MGWGKNLYDLVRIPIKPACNGYYIRWWYNGWHYWFFLPGKHSIVTDGEKYRTIGTRKIVMGTGQLTSEQSYAIRTIFNTREIYLLTIAGWMNIRIEPGAPSIYHNFIPASEFEIVAIIGSKEVSYDNGYSPVEDIPIVPPSVSYCEVNIGNQTWMCENWKSEYPGSRAYNDDNGYRAVFGGLYTFDQIMSPGFCPAGWHIPSYDEWLTLISFCGGQAVAGGILKQAGFGLGYWAFPNTGAVNTFGFSARGGGMYNNTYRIYENVREIGQFWTRDSFDALSAHAIQLVYNNAGAFPYLESKSTFQSARLIKDSLPVSRHILDYDGNIYTVITINHQEWIVESLRTTHYSNGVVIPEIQNTVAWLADVVGALCYYNDDNSDKDVYGILYNWYAVNNVNGLVYFEYQPGVQEVGWRLPTSADITALHTFLGGGATCGGKLKETGLAHWSAPNTGATDEFGYRALASGLRAEISGLYVMKGQEHNCWCADQFDATQAWNYNVRFNTILSELIWNHKQTGMTVRCVRDI